MDGVWSSGGPAHATWWAPVDIEAAVIQAELRGVKKPNIDIDVSGSWAGGGG